MNALLLLAFLAAPAWAGGPRPCEPPLDSPLHCPQRYLPKPRIPSARERDWVLEAINKAKTAVEEEYKAIQTLKRKLEKLKDVQDEAGIIKARQDDLREARALTNAKYAAYREAVRRANIAYGLEPPKTDLAKESGLPQELYRVGPWAPRFSEKEIWDKTDRRWIPRTKNDIKQESKRNTATVDGKLQSAGVATATTRPDGAIALFRRSFFIERENPKDPDGLPLFTPDPDRLALSIYHETAHWVDAAGQGNFRESDTPHALFRGEALAYGYETEFAKRLGRKDSNAADREKLFRRQAEQSVGLSWEQVRQRHPDWVIPESRRSLAPAEADAGTGEPDNPEYAKIEGELKFLEAAERIRKEREEQRRIDEDAQKVVDEAERLWRERGARPTSDNKEIQERLLADMRREVDNSMNWLRSMAVWACADPASLTDKHHKDIRDSYDWLARWGTDFGITSPEMVVNNMTGCSRQLLLRIMEHEKSGLAIPPGFYQKLAFWAAEENRPASPPPYQGDDGGGSERSGRDRGSSRPGRSCADLDTCRRPRW